MIRPKINIASGLLAASFMHLVHPNALFCLAGLCEDNPDICELVTGCYSDREGIDDDACNREWWAFKPIGPHACPPEGCPLYVWVEGSGRTPYATAFPGKDSMLAMLKRGFIAVTVDYANDVAGYRAGEGRIISLLYAAHMSDLPRSN